MASSQIQLQNENGNSSLWLFMKGDGGTNESTCDKQGQGLEGVNHTLGISHWDYIIAPVSFLPSWNIISDEFKETTCP